jgi:hypothetical protein
MDEIKDIVGGWRIYDTTRVPAIVEGFPDLDTVNGCICIFKHNGELEVIHPFHPAYKVKYLFEPDNGDLLLLSNGGESKQLKVASVNKSLDRLSITDDQGEVDFLEAIRATWHEPRTWVTS